MIAVVQGERGTGRKAAVLGHTIAGKTGTAQVGKDHRIGWFTGYGPAKQPEFTVTVMMEGVETSAKDVSPLASQIFKLLLER
jgi:peptidoglycan glycosyltransferase